MPAVSIPDDQASNHAPAAEKAKRYVKMPVCLLENPAISDRAFRFYAKILTYAWESTDSECWASQERLCTELGWSPDKLQRAAKECVAAGVLTCRRTGRTNHYRPVTDRQTAVSDTAEQRYLIPQNSGIGIKHTKVKAKGSSTTAYVSHADRKTATTTSFSSRPATDRQLGLIATLAEERRVEPAGATVTYEQANDEIRRLMAMPRLQSATDEDEDRMYIRPGDVEPYEDYSAYLDAHYDAAANQLLERDEFYIEKDKPQWCAFVGSNSNGELLDECKITEATREILLCRWQEYRNEDPPACLVEPIPEEGLSDYRPAVTW